MAAHTPVKLLLVDDVPANLLALEAVLDRPDYALVRAGSGEEAIGAVEREVFAAILLDIHMPGMDGYETARRIKRLPNGRSVPIMFVTAVYKEDEDMRRGYEAGGLDYFAKPIVPELLRTKVQIYADLYRMTHRAREHDTLLAAIQERQAAERALDKVLQTVSEGVMIFDAAGSVTRTNDEAKWIWCGSSSRTLRGKEDFLGWWVASGKSVQPEEWALSRALASGEVHMNEPIAIQCFDGRRKIVLESASPLLDESGRTIGAVVITKVMPTEAIRQGERRSARPPRRPGPESKGPGYDFPAPPS